MLVSLVGELLVYYAFFYALISFMPIAKESIGVAVTPIISLSIALCLVVRPESLALLSNEANTLWDYAGRAILSAVAGMIMSFFFVVVLNCSNRKFTSCRLDSRISIRRTVFFY